MIKYSSQFGNLTKQRNVERAVESGAPPPLSKKMRQANERDSEGARSPTRGKKAYEDEGRGSERVVKCGVTAS